MATTFHTQAHLDVSSVNLELNINNQKNGKQPEVKAEPIESTVEGVKSEQMSHSAFEQSPQHVIEALLTEEAPQSATRPSPMVQTPQPIQNSVEIFEFNQTEGQMREPGIEGLENKQDYKSVIDQTLQCVPEVLPVEEVPQSSINASPNGQVPQPNQVESFNFNQTEEQMQECLEFPLATNIFSYFLESSNHPRPSDTACYDDYSTVYSDQTSDFSDSSSGSEDSFDDFSQTISRLDRALSLISPVKQRQ